MAEDPPGGVELPLIKRARRLDRLRDLVDRLLPLPSERSRGIGGGAISLVGAAIVLLIAVFTAVILHENDKVARTSAEAHVVQITKTVAYQLTTTLTALDRAMRYAGAEIAEAGTPQRFTQLGNESQLPTRLLAAFVFIGIDGKVVASAMSDNLVERQLDLSDREYFRFPLIDMVTGTYVRRPITSRVSNLKLLPVSRLVRGTKGEPLGVLVAMIDIKSLGRIWTDIGLGSRDTVELIGEDGKVWVRWPEESAGASEAALPASVMQASDGPASDRLVWAQRLAEWPLTIAGGLDRQALQMETAPAQLVIIAAALVVSLLIAWFSFLLAKRTRQAVRERDIATRERLAAAEQRDVLPRCANVCWWRSTRCRSSSWNSTAISG